MRKEAKEAVRESHDLELLGNLATLTNDELKDKVPELPLNDL